MLLIQLLGQGIVVSGVFLKVSTRLAFVANNAVRFVLLTEITRWGLREEDEAVLTKQYLDWEFSEVTKNNIAVFESFQSTSETTNSCFDNMHDRKSFFDEFQFENKRLKRAQLF